MDYLDKIKLINTKKEKLSERLSRLIEKEKTLNSVARKVKRAEEEKRKYILGGLVLAAMRECGIDDFENAEVIGALIKSFENQSPTARAVYKSKGEKTLFANRQIEKQSASAQGFTQSEVAEERITAMLNQ